MRFLETKKEETMPTQQYPYQTKDPTSLKRKRTTLRLN